MYGVIEDCVCQSETAAAPEVDLRGVPEEAWFPSAYECLRDIAERLFRQEAVGHTLQPTAIVHEAYMRMAQGDRTRLRDRSHFVALAARTLRHVLVDHARRRKAAKRGGDRQRVAMEEAEACTQAKPPDLLRLDEALTTMAKNHERASRVVELRYFSGLSTEETASVLQVSVRTVKSDWRFARAWLNDALSADQQ